MAYPSIFNDVIGPVMRGPSSSHCAASLRIGRLCLDLMDGSIDSALIEFDPQGSLATTHEGQGSDMGLLGGFLGWEAHDERLPNYKQAIAEAGIDVEVKIHDIDANHPNTYKITLKNSEQTRTVIALSVGGGMIEVIEIEGASVELVGDYCELLIYTQQPDLAYRWVTEHCSHDACSICTGSETFVQVKLQQFPDVEKLSMLLDIDGVSEIKKLRPVLPVMSRQNLKIPFESASEMLEYNRDKQLPLWELAVHYEAARGDLSHKQVWLKMKTIVGIMSAAVKLGLQGTEYSDRILPCQSLNFKAQMDQGTLVQSDVLNTIILSVSAIMEVKSSMGVIVAAPTAGSCGALPGAVLGVAQTIGSNEEETIQAMFAAAMIGVFIANKATFAAEVGGCQAECGSGAGMAAAAIVQLSNGAVEQSLVAASLALQNSFGMVCDPIANRVEAPCLGKNVMAATNALSCANMALAGYNPLIPLDEVIVAMHATGESISSDLRCTGRGGLAITESAKAIERKLAEQGMVGASVDGKHFKVC